MADTEGEHEQRHHVRNHRHNLRRNSVRFLYTPGAAREEGSGELAGRRGIK